jgi:hypothetical protein
MKGDEVKSFTLVLDEANTITFCRDAGEHIKLHRQALIKKPNPLFIDWLVLTIDSSSEPDMPTQWAIPVLFHPTSDGMACMLNNEPVVLTLSSEIPDVQTAKDEMNTRNEELQLPMPFPLHKAILSKVAGISVARGVKLEDIGYPYTVSIFAKMFGLTPKQIREHATNFDRSGNRQLKNTSVRASNWKFSFECTRPDREMVHPNQAKGDAQAFCDYLSTVHKTQKRGQK